MAARAPAVMALWVVTLAVTNTPTAVLAESFAWRANDIIDTINAQQTSNLVWALAEHQLPEALFCNIVNRFKGQERKRLRAALEADQVLMNIVDEVNVKFSADRYFDSDWEERASEMYMLLAQLGLAFEVEVPSMHWRLRHAHDTVSETFRKNIGLSETVEELCSSRLRPTDFPPLYAVDYDNVYWCLCNRRLWCLKTCQVRLGEELLVPLRVIPACIMPEKFISAWTALRTGSRSPGLYPVPRCPKRGTQVQALYSGYCSCLLSLATK